MQDLKSKYLLLDTQTQFYIMCAPNWLLSLSYHAAHKCHMPFRICAQESTMCMWKQLTPFWEYMAKLPPWVPPQQICISMFLWKHYSLRGTVAMNLQLVIVLWRSCLIIVISFLYSWIQTSYGYFTFSMYHKSTACMMINYLQRKLEVTPNILWEK